ncbi:hypothetical protein MRX96_043363 [Rhipicephalus microplus]
MPGYHPPVVGIADGQNAPVGLCVDACGFLAKPRTIVRRGSRCRDCLPATRHCGVVAMAIRLYPLDRIACTPCVA